ncbi:MAG: hypothetical protein L0227_01260 [Chloroflexi bacterium]|nr:hypothetical protein [Chloroflexota bacterium]
MIRAVASLARHRLTGRAGATLLLIAAVAAATGLTGTIRALGLSATDEAVASALAGLDPADRSVRISGYAPSNLAAAELAAAAGRATAETVAYTETAAAGVILRRVRDPATSYDLQLVAVDGVEAWTTLVEGRAPASCDGIACEAVLLSVVAAPADLPEVLHIGNLEVRIVGRGTLASPVPLGHLDERGPQPPPADPTAQQPNPPPALLLVDGVAATAAAPGAAAVGRTYLWTAPLEPATIHPWTVDPLEAALTAARRGLSVESPSLSLTAPSETLRAQLVRGAVNDGRLLLVGTLGVAILVAFAGYAALLGRRDLRAELDRLGAAGAGRGAGALLVALEVLLPVAAGTAIGWTGAAAVAGLVAPGSGTEPGGVIGHALLDPGSLALAGLVLGASIAAIIGGLVGLVRREVLVGLVPGGLAIAALVGWRLVAGGGLEAAALGSSVEAPVLAAIPAIAGIAVAAVALAIVPAILRRLAGSSRRLSISIRLALVSLARDPVRPAATITLLAFGIGGLDFAIADAATLRRSMADQAAFNVGMDLRVVEAPSGLTLTTTVVPFERYAVLGPGVEAVPVAHVAAAAGPAGDLTVVGLPPSALSLLRGWRDDLGRDPASLAAAIDVEGDFAVPGVTLPAGTAEITVTVTHTGDPVYLSAVVANADGDATRLFLGTLKPGRETLHGAIPGGATGWQIVGLIVSEGRLIAGADHLAGLARATLAFEGLDPIVGPDPVAVEVSGTQPAIFRAPLTTDELILPAVAGPAIAAAARAGEDGTLTLTLGDRRLVRIRVVDELPRLPGVPEAGADFVLVDLDPLLAAMGGAAPGSGRPDEAWIRVDDPARLDEVRAALGEAPFRASTIRSRAGLEAAAAADPFARSILAAIAAAGLAGLLLAALGLTLGALADVRDETGELRDLEGQGIGPRALRRQVGARTLLLAAGGTVSGLAMGLGLAAIVTAALGVGADLARPVPSLVLELPWAGLAAAVVVPMAVAATLVGIAAGRAFRASSRTRDRA